jgi:D-alanyl-lipoteichoic acid acyltransferase DltB (MBOAT superfamily)
MQALGVRLELATPGIALPVGISFYTFQTLAYTIDVYRGRLRPADSFLDYALFVSFFPQLVAGPIVRAAEFLPQCAAPPRTGAREMGWGLSLLALGLFEKVVLADAVFRPLVEEVYGHPLRAGFREAWVGSLAFSGQLFFDFSGYTSCAIGAALCLGFQLPRNVRSPYACVGISDFWRRWHISFSTWLRDYLYVSLGGNRRGVARTYVNVVSTMLLAGLWHGAAWHFVAWGGAHGVVMALERPFRRQLERIERSPVGSFFGALLSFLLLTLLWPVFRAETGDHILHLCGVMLTGGEGRLRLDPFGVGLALAAIALTWLGQWLMRETSVEEVAARIPWGLRALALAGMLVALALAPGGDHAFIYFQF